jgi:hypothetical protein
MHALLQAAACHLGVPSSCFQQENGPEEDSGCLGRPASEYQGMQSDAQKREPMMHLAKRTIA